MRPVSTQHFKKQRAMKAPFQKKRGAKGKGKSQMKKNKQQEVLTPFQIVWITHTELMTELLTKFPKLYNMSLKTNHKLLDAIAWKVCERLELVINTGEMVMENGFILSKAYRRRHQHFTDYTLVMQTLHSIQDATGVPRTEISEADLTKVTVLPAVLGDLPYDTVNGLTSRYCTKITYAICTYISNLNCEPHQMDTKETAARKKIQQELKKMLPNMSMLIQQMTRNRMVPSSSPYHRCKLYGEPFLPTRDNTDPILKMFRPVHIRRSDRIYNMIKFNVPLTKFQSLMGWDGKTVAGATIRIRSSDIPKYRSKEVIMQLRRNFGNAEELAAQDDWEVAEEAEPCDMEVEDTDYTEN